VTHAMHQQFTSTGWYMMRYILYITKLDYRRNPVDTVVRNRVTLAIILSRTMQAAFGTSRAIPKLRCRRSTRASILRVYCIVVASCHGEINVTPASWEWQTIEKKIIKNNRTGEMRWPLEKELTRSLWCLLHLLSRSSVRISYRLVPQDSII